MSLSPEQIALIEDAAAYVGIKGGFIRNVAEPYFRLQYYKPNGSQIWWPHIDHGDLYDLMAAGKVVPDWDNLLMEIGKDVDWLGASFFSKDDFTSQAWAVITVCAMAQRRKGE